MSGWTRGRGEDLLIKKWGDMYIILFPNQSLPLYWSSRMLVEGEVGSDAETGCRILGCCEPWIASSRTKTMPFLGWRSPSLTKPCVFLCCQTKRYKKHLVSVCAKPTATTTNGFLWLLKHTQQINGFLLLLWPWVLLRRAHRSTTS